MRQLLPAVHDPRIAAALSWCEAQGIDDLTLAMPGEQPAAMSAQLTSLAAVRSVILAAEALPPEPDDRFGVFLPERYTWRLPAQLSSRIVFIAGREKLSARMLATALARRVRTIVYWDLERWHAQPVIWLAAYRARTKLMALLQGATGRLGARTSRVTEVLEALTRARLQRCLRLAAPVGHSDCNHPRRVIIACPTLVAGGAERQIVNTASGLHRDAGLDLTVIVSNLNAPPGNDFFRDPLVAAGIAVQEIEGPLSSLAAWERYEALKTSGVARAIRPLLKALPAETAQEVLNLYIAFRELQPAVVHAWLDHSCICAGLAAVMAGVPRIILSGRNVSPIRFPYILQPIMRPAYQAIASSRSVVFANNSHGGAADYAAWLGFATDRFQIVYNGLDLTTMRPAGAEARAAFRQHYGIPSGATLVGGMFRLSPEKRPFLWVESLARLAAARDDVYGLVFGAGPLLAEIEASVVTAGLKNRVRVAPPTRENTLALSAFDLLLLTSRWEGTPNVVIEAQSVGTPVVVCGDGGAEESLAHAVTGLFVAQPSVEAIAAALAALVSDLHLRERLATAGPPFVAERFGLPRMLSATLSLYGWEQGEARD